MIIGGLCGLLAIGSVANAAVIWDTGDPISHGFSLVGTVDPSNFQVDTPSAGFLTQDTVTVGAAAHYQNNSTTEFDNALGWKVEVRLNTTASSSDGDVYLLVADGQGGTELAFRSNGYKVYTNAWSSLQSYSSGFHTFLITRAAGEATNYSIQVDGGTATSYTDFAYALGIQWGDSASTGGKAVWDYVKINAVPEPTSLALLGLGGAALLMRRRRG
jgi:hypothetical protein